MPLMMRVAIDLGDQRGEKGVAARILAHRAVFDEAGSAQLDELRDRGGGQEIVTLDIEDDGLAEPVGKAPYAVRGTVERGRELRRQHHDGGEGTTAQDLRLVHHLAVVGPDRRDDESVRRAVLGQHVEEGRKFREAGVVEIGIAAVEQGRDAALHVPNELAVRRAV